MKTQALYDRLVALEQQEGWRILLSDTGRRGHLEFPKRPEGYQPPPLAPADSSPENLKGVEIAEQLVRPDAIKTGVYSNVYLYSIKDRQAVPIFGLSEAISYVSSATMSPDGQRIALWVWTPEDEKTQRSQLVLLDGQGHFQEKLLDAASVGNIAWSSDGTKLVFVANYQQMTDRFIPNTQAHPSQGNLFIFDLATKTPRMLVRGGVSGGGGLTSHAWSSDDREIVYEGIDDNILIYNLETGQSRTLIAKGLSEGSPTWSPSSEWIAYMGADRNYYRIHPDGSGQEMLLENFKSRWWHIFSFPAMVFGWEELTDIYGPLVWSPDSRFLLYARSAGEGHGYALFVVDLKTHQQVRLPGNVTSFLPLRSWVRTSKRIGKAGDRY